MAQDKKSKLTHDEVLAIVAHESFERQSEKWAKGIWHEVRVQACGECETPCDEVATFISHALRHFWIIYPRCN